MRILQGLGLWVMALTLGFVAHAGARAPTPPKGLQPCENPFELATAPDWPIGEKIRYSLWLDGLAVGSVEFRVESLATKSFRNQVSVLAAKIQNGEAVIRHG